MDFNMIWQRIKELAMMFYQFTMTQGENKFMLVEFGVWNTDALPKETYYFFAGSFVVMILLAIFACDSFEILSPGDGIAEWGEKVSIFKVIKFTAAVFSVHTFYKMLVALTAAMIGADGSIRALECLGTFINPIAIMAYAFAIATMNFRRIWFQAACLGWATFLTPAAMSFSGFTPEHIAIYATAGALGLVGAIAYKRLSPYKAYFVLCIAYLIAKFFMIYYSDQVTLLTAETRFGQIKQYFACIQMDLVIMVVLSLILMVYRLVTVEDLEPVVEFIFSGLLAVIMIVGFILGHGQLSFKPDYEYALSLMEAGRYQEAMSSFASLSTYRDSKKLKKECYYAVCKPQYEMAIGLMNQGRYADAKAILSMFPDYLDSAVKIEECSRMIEENREPNLWRQLAGHWVGVDGTHLILRDNGSCTYYEENSSGEGNWGIREDRIIYIVIPSCKLDLYVEMGDAFDGTRLNVESNQSNWLSEEFFRAEEENTQENGQGEAGGE